jgi:hypothetical protein
MRFVSMLLIPAVLAVVAGCEQRGPFVYVLDGQQTVVLKATASATKVQQGEKVVLHVERQSKGNWQRVSRGELKPGQCWVYRPPAEAEAEVAQNVQWVVEPERAVEFHTEYQMDQSRVATMMIKGTVKLTPVGKVQCEEGRTVEGAPIEIEVT